MWLFKCLQTSQLLWRLLPKAMKGSLFAFSPVSGTNVPEVDCHNRASSSLKFLSSPQLKLNNVIAQEEIHLNYTYSKRVYISEICRRFIDKCLLFLPTRKLINLSTA